VRRSSRLLILLGLTWLSAHEASAKPVPATPVQAHTDRPEMVARGKQLFVARCSGCHGENGEEPVDDGPSLKARTLDDKRLTSVVESRLKGGTPEEKLAVKLYLSTLVRPAL
jgi:mono/diheme cytochrome c family protein